ncbi:MAG: HAD family hydrolase [Sedimentisphaerales bacterium]|nr:HAD family hydrolase [Sedimentisphaerales bacterium]
MDATEKLQRDTAGAHIKAVLFDLGDTLLDFGKIQVAKIFAEGAALTYDYLKSLGQPVGSRGWYFLKYLARLRLRRTFNVLRGRDFDALASLREVGTKEGLKLTDEQWRQVAWLWYEPLTGIGCAEPDIVETLTALRDSGLKLGILSNTFVHGSSLDKHLEQLGILEFFSPRVYSYEFPFRKPDHRIFAAACERISEAPENILFVGDLIGKDIKPALKCGMFAALKEAHSNVGKRLPPGAHRIARISELPGLIRKLNAGSAGKHCSTQ